MFDKDDCNASWHHRPLASHWGPSEEVCYRLYAFTPLCFFSSSSIKSSLNQRCSSFCFFFNVIISRSSQVLYDLRLPFSWTDIVQPASCCTQVYLAHCLYSVECWVASLTIWPVIQKHLCALQCCDYEGKLDVLERKWHLIKDLLHKAQHSHSFVLQLPPTVQRQTLAW